jgi:hypothetical protein
MTDTTTSEVLKEMAEKSRAALERRGEAFPDVWDFAKGPAVMAAFPEIRMTKTGPLIEFTHASDGVVYTFWLNNNVLTNIRRVGVKTGMPCVITRSAEKHRYFNERLGYEVDSWSWDVTTPHGSSASGGGRAVSIEEASQFFADEVGTAGIPQKSAPPELEADAVEVAPPVGDDSDLPY